MTKIVCPVGQWTTITSGVTNQSFNLINEYPDPVQLCIYKVHTGLAVPAVDTQDYILGKMDGDDYAHGISFNNSVVQNIYVMSVETNGSVVI